MNKIQRKSARRAAAAALAAAAATTLLASAPASSQATDAKALINKARGLARSDLRAEFQSLCEPTPETIAVRKDQTRGVMQPIRVFDNLYFVGKNSIGATALTTSEGIILIDTMWDAEDAATIVIPGLISLGLDPKDIKYVISTHAHMDHFGGIPYLRAHYPKIKVIMPDADWAAKGTSAFRADGDIGFPETYDLTLGDTTVHMVRTPGHTPGTVSMLYPVKWQGKTYTAMQWGGGVPHDENFSPDVVDSFLDRAKSSHAAARWQNHPKPDTRAMIADVRAGKNPHPFIFGEEKFGRYLDIIKLCKRAGVDAG